MNLKSKLQSLLKSTIIKLWPETKEMIVSGRLLVEVERPTEERFGDYSTNLAMKLGAIFKIGPLQTAQHIAESLKINKFEKIVAIAPGFINFYLDKKWVVRQVSAVLKEKHNFGKGKSGKGKKVQVEFVSANPTGPLTIGNGRGAFSGDTLANILKLAGYRAQREYYVNDRGNQVNILAESVLRRYWQHHGIKIDYPEYCYQGKYIDDLAEHLFLPNYKLNNTQKLEEVRDKIKGRILQKMINNIKKLLENKLKIKYDHWFSEKRLYTTGQVDKVLAFLKEKGLLYKSEGAIWLKTKEYGDGKDHVLVKADEEPVYFLSDIAYHWNKFSQRHFQKVIDIWGADHHGYVGRLQAATKMLGYEGSLDIIIAQLVRLMHNGQEMKMSKRSGTFVTLEELVDEVGLDVARFFFLMYDFNTHLDFDLDLAKKKSKDNPVYYVQYAHARICSIIKKAKNFELGTQNLELERTEISLIKELMRWPELLLEVSQNYQVQKLPFYAINLATKFHDFYTQCRVIDNEVANESRLNLVKATQIVLQSVLGSMGVSAPEKM